MADSSFEAICQPTPHPIRSASTNGSDTRCTQEDRATPTSYRYATAPRPMNEHYSGSDPRRRAFIRQAAMCGERQHCARQDITWGVQASRPRR